MQYSSSAAFGKFGVPFRSRRNGRNSFPLLHLVRYREWLALSVSLNDQDLGIGRDQRLFSRFVLFRKPYNPIAESTQAFSESSPKFRDFLAAKEEHGDSEEHEEVRRREQIFQHDDISPLTEGSLSVG
jgi:hypothetical protein